MADFTEQNREYFDKMAKSYRDHAVDVVETLSKETQDRRHWISDKWTDTDTGRGQEVRMLEYACGPGYISISLAPFLTKAIGLDVSSNMLDEYNKNVSEAGLCDKMTARKGDLLAETLSDDVQSPELFNFDLVVVSMSLHHFADPGMAMRRLGERLKKGGVFYIIDFVPDDSYDLHGEFAEAAKTIKTHGFTRDDMWKLYSDAGVCKGFDYQVVEKPVELTKNGETLRKTVFVARSQRE